jgi:hypothetical protein
MSSQLKSISKEEFCAAINLPKEWLERDLYPDSFFEAQLSECISVSNKFIESGYVTDGEHYRNALYWHWLRNGIDKEIIVELVSLEPDRKLRDWFLRKMRDNGSMRKGL